MPCKTKAGYTRHGTEVEATPCPTFLNFYFLQTIFIACFDLTYNTKFVRLPIRCSIIFLFLYLLYIIYFLYFFNFAAEIINIETKALKKRKEITKTNNLILYIERPQFMRVCFFILLLFYNLLLILILILMLTLILMANSN